MSGNIFPGRSTPPPSLHRSRPSPSAQPRNGSNDLVECQGRCHLPVPALSWFVRLTRWARRNIIRARYGSNSQRVVGSGIWRKRGLRRDDLLRSTGLTWCSRWEEFLRAGGAVTSANRPNRAREPTRTALGSSGAGRMQPGRSKLELVTETAPHIHGNSACCSCSVADIAMHARPPLRSGRSERRRSLARCRFLLVKPTRSRQI